MSERASHREIVVPHRYMYMQIIFASQPHNPRQANVGVGQLRRSWYGAIFDPMITYLYTKNKTEYEGQEVYARCILSKLSIWSACIWDKNLVISY